MMPGTDRLGFYPPSPASQFCKYLFCMCSRPGRHPPRTHSPRSKQAQLITGWISYSIEVPPNSICGQSAFVYTPGLCVAGGVDGTERTATIALKVHIEFFY